MSFYRGQKRDLLFLFINGLRATHVFLFKYTIYKSRSTRLLVFIRFLIFDKVSSPYTGIEECRHTKSLMMHTVKRTLNFTIN